MDKTLLVECILNAFLAGLIWTVQLLIYPSFRFVEKNNYRSFHLFHMKTITPIVAPVMILEFIISCFNSYRHAHYYSVAFLIVIWGTTFLISVPIHEKLLMNKDEKLINNLIKTNWLRTIAWTLKLLFISILLFD